MEGIFRESFGPLLEQKAFEYAGKNRWIRNTAAGFKHVFYLYPFRPGADYYPHGALSFDFVPRIEAGKVRLRPEAKDTRIHFSVAGYGLAEDKRITRNCELTLQQCQKLAPVVVPQIVRSLSSFQSLEDVLAAFQRAEIKHRGCFDCYPETLLSYAFILAKFGSKADAEGTLRRALKTAYFAPETRGSIRRIFETTAKSAAEPKLN